MRARAEKTCRGIIKIIDSIVDFLVLCVVLILLAFASYAMWDSSLLYQQADATQYTVYKPSVKDEGKSFEELQSINPEVFAWLTVYGTNIDYPVTQAADNSKYVNFNAEGQYSLSGAIFLDYRNKADYSDFNSILYGHHMEKQKMFGDIGSFSDKEMFDTRLYGNMYYEGRDHGIEFFAFVHTDAYDSAVFDPAAREPQAYLDNILETAMYTRDIGLTVSDRIVLLSTCSSDSTNGRDILLGRIVDEIFKDNFITVQETDGSVTHLTVDAQDDTWALIPLWFKLSAIVLDVLLILSIIVIQHKKKNNKKGRTDI